MFGTLLGFVVTRVASEKVVKKVVLSLANKLVKSTKNDLDDKILKNIKKALGEKWA